MPTTVRITPYGPAAHDALAETIDQLKADDRLAPVTVVVGSNHVGVAARRALGRRRGIAAVTFLTPYRLAELLGATRVARQGRRPVSTPVVAGAVRAVLADDPGHFAGVASHPATERSLVRAHRTLSELDDAALRRLRAAGPRTAEVVRIHHDVAARLRPHFSDEQDLIGAAIESLHAATPLLARLGPVIVFLPQRLTNTQTRLLAAVAERHPLHVIAGLTGDDAADAPVRSAVERLGGEWVVGDPLPPPVADAALSVSDADDEVRHAVREVVAGARDGIPLSRCAILYGNADPYGRLIADALDGAKIPWFGSSVRTAEASLLGRSLLALLALPDHDLARRDVTAWLAGAPVRGPDGRFAPVAGWERASRGAGVVAGLDQWRDRLARRAEDLEADADRFERDDAEAWRADRLRRDADHTRGLAGFVTGLAGDLDPGRGATTWRGLASWCRRLVRTYLGGEALREHWPEDERAAGQRIDAAIDRLGDLDGVDPNPSTAAFRRALELQLADDLGRHGSFGHGVLVGGVGLAVGLELDRVVVVGLAEGSFPARRRDDPLLPDRVRSMAGADLPTRADRVHDDHRALLAVLAAATHTTFTFPRGDLRRRAERAPGRWLLDTCEARDGVRPSAERLDRETGEWLTEVPSFVAGLRAAPFPAHAQEYDVRALLDLAEAGGSIAASPLVADRPALARGVALIAGRLSSRFTRFDGNLATEGDLRGARVPSPMDVDEVTSATRLETWASCPHAYFVRHVLRVDPVEDPEEQYRITPLTRGSMIHDVLDRWIGDMIDAGRIPRPGRVWTDDDLGRLETIALAEADRLQARGLVGRSVYWQRDRQVMLHDLTGFARFDQEERAAHGASPIATELPFGMPGADTAAVTVTLPSGRRLRLRGAIDRVDRTPDGTLRVIDYKTGRSDGYRNLSADDPTPGGTHLQLVLYAIAAREVLGHREVPAEGNYWFVTSRGGFRTAGYPVTAAVEETVLATVERIVDGIAAGLFPLHPGRPRWRSFPDCLFCEPDGLGVAHQYADWSRHRDDPVLVPYLDVCGADD